MQDVKLTLPSSACANKDAILALFLTSTTKLDTLHGCLITMLDNPSVFGYDTIKTALRGLSIQQRQELINMGPIPAVFYAILHKQLDVITLLEHFGAKINAIMHLPLFQDKMASFTPLGFAIAHDNYRRYEDPSPIVLLLLGLGASPAVIRSELTQEDPYPQGDLDKLSNVKGPEHMWYLKRINARLTWPVSYAIERARRLGNISMREYWTLENENMLPLRGAFFKLIGQEPACHRLYDIFLTSTYAPQTKPLVVVFDGKLFFHTSIRID